MRVAVLSDIHANLHALEAVLADVGRTGAEAVWCLGDVVGYGPQPSRCCELVRDRCGPALAGNHDLGVLGTVDVAAFSPEAAEAARWTAAVLEPEARAFLATLEPAAETAEALLVHGSPRDPVWEYVLTDEAAEAALEDSTRPLVLVGHSHVALALEWAAGDGLRGGLAPAGTEVDLRDGARWLLNPGAVGQPRDGDPRAAWLLLDLGERRASFRRTAYALERTQAEIRAAGLPEGLAARLAHGD